MAESKKTDQKVTLQDIADSLGISRGTVDRALHNRGRINQDTKERILHRAREMGYIDRRLSQFMPLRENRKILVVSPGDPGFFFRTMEEGVEQAVQEAGDAGFRLEFLRFDRDRLQAVQMLREACREKASAPAGILLVPTDDAEMVHGVKELAPLPVVTVNTDLAGSRRLCFVGQDLYKSGRLGGELLAKMIKGSSFLCLSGFENVQAHAKRAEGAAAYLAGGPLTQAGEVLFCRDNPEEAERLLEEYARTAALPAGILCLTGAATLGAARFLEQSGRTGTVVIGYDRSEELLDLLQRGQIQALITQDAFHQGYYGGKILIKVLLEGYVPDRESYFTRTDILLKEHLGQASLLPEFLGSS